MRRVIASLIFGTFISPALLAQAVKSSSDSFCKTIRQQSQYISIFPVVAEKLLIRKVNPVWNQNSMEARGTVVVQFELGKHGEVLCPRVISGPKLLQQPVLDAIRKYEYMPYLLNGKAVVVSTTTSIAVSNY
jgi:hypothetical protein